MQRIDLVWSEAEIEEEITLGLDAGDSLDTLAARLDLPLYAVTARVRRLEEASEQVVYKGRPPSELPASYSVRRLCAIVAQLGGPSKASRAAGVPASKISCYTRGGRPSANAWGLLVHAAAAHAHDAS